jgi:small subunit ribosomal protein S7
LPRSSEYKKHDLKGDPVYNSKLVAKFINNIMERGKKSLAQRIFYRTLEIIQNKYKQEPLETFEKAIKNLLPTLEVKSRRVGGATYQVPVEVRPERKYALAMRWVLAYARQKPGRTFAEKLASELLDAANGVGSSIKKKEDTHKMAEANKAFSQFRW